MLPANHTPGLRQSAAKSPEIGSIIWLVLFFCMGLYAALALRLHFFDFASSDYRDFLSHWYGRFKEQGFHALTTSFGEYTPAYPYFLGLFYMALPDVPPLYAVKTISIIGDCFAAILAWKITKTLFPESWARPTIAAIAVLLSPEIIANGSVSAQCDIWYSIFLFISFYYLIRHKPRSALAWFGLSLAFKPWGIFLAPYFALHLFTGRIRWRDIWITPVVYYLTFIPAYIAGQSFFNMAYAYSFRTDSFLAALNFNAANFPWIVNQLWQVQDRLTLTGILLIVITIIFYIEIMFITLKAIGKKFYAMTPEMHLLLAVFFLNAAPYLLPSMHERYFFTANLFAVILACWNIRYLPVALLLNISSLLTYPYFLFPWNQLSPGLENMWYYFMWYAFTVKSLSILFVAVDYYMRLRSLTSNSTSKLARFFPAP